MSYTASCIGSTNLPDLLFVVFNSSTAATEEKLEGISHLKMRAVGGVVVVIVLCLCTEALGVQVNVSITTACSYSHFIPPVCRGLDCARIPVPKTSTSSG